MRVGIDVVRVPDVAESIAHFGLRYLQRVFTPHELATVTAGAPDVLGAVADPVAARRLAARFAAKEACVKVLAPSGAQPDWRAMGVRTGPDGAPALVLTGSAAAAARAAGLHRFAVSLSHEGDIAAAVVIADAQLPMKSTDDPVRRGGWY